jgi:hypothetical protein
MAERENRTMIAGEVASSRRLRLPNRRRAICRDARGVATGPLGTALDLIAKESAP